MGRGSYAAPLVDGNQTRPKKYVIFSEWWEKVVIVDSNKNKFTRRELVLTLANKEGGAHVDPLIDEAYAELTRHNSVGWIVSDGKSEMPINDVELFSVRQIAHEVLKSLERQFPENT